MENTLLNNNYAKISGKIVKEYTTYHKTLGEEFFMTEIEVVRQSGGVDILPVVVSEKLLDDSIKNADFVCFEGQIRTYNKKDGSVETYLFAKDIHFAEEGTYINEVRLRGFLCKKGRYRTTYTERKILDFILAVNRLFNKSDYLPVLAWGKDAKYMSNQDISNELEIVGRFQSRRYSKKDINGVINSKVTYEISASQITAIK